MSRAGRPSVAFGVFAVLIVVAACGSDDATVPTGVADVDAILAAVAANDAPSLIPLLALRNFPCRRYGPDDIYLAGHGDLSCTDDEATDTLVPTYWSGACEGSWWERSEAEPLASVILSWNLDLYGVYENAQYRSIPAEYVAVFRTNDFNPYRGVGLYIAEGGIMGIEQDCGTDPSGLVEFLGLEEVILSPQSTPP